MEDGPNDVPQDYYISHTVGYSFSGFDATAAGAAAAAAAAAAYSIYDWDNVAGGPYYVGRWVSSENGNLGVTEVDPVTATSVTYGPFSGEETPQIATSVGISAYSEAWRDGYPNSGTATATSGPNTGQSLSVTLTTEAP